MIRNVINAKCYIGSSQDIPQRFSNHKMELRQNIHHSIVLQRAVDKYGISNFAFTCLEATNQQNLIKREQYYFNKLKPEYNISKIAGRTVPTAEMKLAASVRMSGEKHPFFGKKRPSHATRMKGKKNPFYGKHHSSSTKKLLALSIGKINPTLVVEIRNRHKYGETYNQLSVAFGLSNASICRIVNRKAWSF